MFGVEGDHSDNCIVHIDVWLLENRETIELQNSVRKIFTRNLKGFKIEKTVTTSE